MVLPQLSQADETSHDYNTILDQLTSVYNNPNKVQEAEDKLYALKQGTDSLHAYMAKFEHILYEARGQDWPDVNKIYYNVTEALKTSNIKTVLCVLRIIDTEERGRANLPPHISLGPML
jgi:hypothetical protein